VSKQVTQKKKSSNKVFIPIILLMGIIPLIVHTYSYNSNLSQFNWFPSGADSQTDFFFGWKMITIIVVGIVMAGILFYQYFKKKQGLRFENAFYFLFFYAMFVAMSALFSSYKYWVVRGSYELFEPVWVVFVYILLCYYTYHFVQEEQQVKFILCGAGIGMAVVTLIGVFQYFGMDFFKTGFGKHLITNPSWWDNLDSLSFNMLEGTSYTTLYNPNFLSFYFGMLIPLLVCVFIAAKKAWQRVLIIVAEVLCLICLKGSRSDTGWMALVVGGVILALVLLSRKKKAFCVALAIMLIGGVAAVAVGSKTDVGIQIKNTIVGTFRIDDRYAVRDIDTGTDSVMLNVRGNKMYVSYTTDESGVIVPNCTDENGQTLELAMTDADNQIYVINDERFAGGSIQPILLGDDNIPAISVTYDGIAWDFVETQEAGYCYLNKSGKLVKWEKIKNANLFKEDAMSYRGHMWNVTIPLLGKHVLIGSGANTYMFEYPQDDYLGQAYIYGFNSYEVKAHCWYLQQWVESGLIGTLALLIFMAWYAVQSIRIYRRVDLHESLSWIGFGLFAAVLVYLIAGIANDSNVCTAPVFWGMLGLGMATNRMLVEKEKLFVKDVVTTVGDEGQTETLAVEPNKKVMKEDEAVAVKPKQTSNKKQSRKQRKNQKK
jgi:O-antigen ligase